MRVAGGPNVIQDYLSQVGISDMKVVNTEKEMGADWNVQYQNWATPLAAVDLLYWLQTASMSDDDQQLLLRIMGSTATGPNRLKGLLPKGVATTAHKTGTSGTRDGVTAATNDIGLIGPPNGKHIAIAVFVSDSPADEKTRDAVIAKIAKAAWDKWSK